jgi:tripartite-type tricarboxylate transporter receptor subunit TctC
MKTPVATALLALSAFAALPHPADAQQYPSKPIRLVVPFPPGGGVDVLARALAAGMPDGMGQPVVVENRPGANGVIAAELVAKSAPDGYTLLTSGSWLQVGSFVYKKLPYDPARDFTPVMLVAETPMQIITSAAVPATTLPQFVAYSKANPGKLNYGTPGVGHPFHLSVEMFKHRTGADLVHVPYKGGAPVIQDFMAGRIDMIFFPLNPQLTEMIRNGKARVLATATPQRMPSLPDVPTFAELGIRDFITAANIAIAGPAGMPRPVVNRLHAEIVKASGSPQALSAYQGESLLRSLSTPEEYGRIVKNELDTWGPLIKSLNISLD